MGQSVGTSEGGLYDLHKYGPIQEYIPPAKPGWEQQNNAQNSPHSKLPARGELVPEHGLDDEQEYSHAGGGQCLQEKCPDIAHSLYLHFVQQLPELIPLLGGDGFLF